MVFLIFLKLRGGSYGMDSDCSGSIFFISFFMISNYLCLWVVFIMLFK